MQTGVDARITFADAAGTELDTVDSFEWTQETITFIARSSGRFRVTVARARKNGPIGSYQLVSEKLQPTEEIDEVRVRAQRISTQAKQLESGASQTAYRQAYEYGYESLRLWREAGVPSGELGTLLRLGEIDYATQEYGRAREYFEQALKLSRELNDSRGQGTSRNDMAMVNLALDRPIEALNDFAAALELWQASAFRYGLAAVLSNRSTLYGHMGEFTLAVQDGTRALDHIRLVGDLHGEAFVHHSLGVAYGWLGDPEKALAHLDRAVVLFRAVSDVAGAARSMLLCGRAQLWMGHPARAMNLERRSLEALRASADAKWEAEALDALGRAYWALGEHDKAVEHYRRSLELARTSRSGHEEANALEDVGDYLAGSGETTQAGAAYTDALRLRREEGWPDGEADAMYRLARLASSQQHLEEAREWIEQALGITESLRNHVPGDQFRTTYLAERQGQYSLYIDVLMQLHLREPAAGFDRLAFEASERARARSLLDQQQEARSEVREGLSASLLEQERSLRRNLNYESWRLANGAAGAPATEESLRSKLESLTRDYEELEGRIRAESPHYAVWMQAQPLGLGDVQREVVGDSGTLLLELALGEDRSYLFAVTASALKAYPLPSRSGLEGTARRIRTYISQRPLPETAAKAEAQFRRDSRSLSEAVFGPAAEDLGNNRLLVVADGALQTIPLAVLPSPGQGDGFTPLLSRHEIIYLPSASVLAAARRELASRPVAPRALAVLADPVYDAGDDRVRRAGGHAAEVTGRSLKYGRLIFSRQEAESIYAVAPKDGRMKAVDFAASKGIAMSPELGRYRIIHFSSHGVLNDQRPELSGLVLSLVNERGEPVDGFLRLHEIYNLSLPAELVVLNACESGLGKQVAGEGMLSLIRAFLYAGAKTVEAGLWRLDDESTGVLMQEMYRSLFGTSQVSPAAALRMAQEKIRAQRRWHHPYYWAGFVLEGEWRTLATQGRPE